MSRDERPMPNTNRDERAFLPFVAVIFLGFLLGIALLVVAILTDL